MLGGVGGRSKEARAGGGIEPRRLDLAHAAPQQHRQTKTVGRPTGLESCNAHNAYQVSRTHKASIIKPSSTRTEMGGWVVGWAISLRMNLGRTRTGLSCTASRGSAAAPRCACTLRSLLALGWRSSPRASGGSDIRQTKTTKEKKRSQGQASAAHRGTSREQDGTEEVKAGRTTTTKRGLKWNTQNKQETALGLESTLGSR